MKNTGSLSEIKFLIDENVKRRLAIFLEQNNFDVVLKPKGLLNGKLAEYSKNEKRILITNDNDFSKISKDKLFGVILLKIPQDKPNELIIEFSKLLKNKNRVEDYQSKLITLYEDKIEEFNLR